MKSNLDYILLTIQMCVLFLISFMVAIRHKVAISELESTVSRQQVQLENQALDIQILKGKK